MKNNKANYLIVGTFVLLVIAGVVTSVALLTGRTGATDDYYAVYDNVTGIEFGTRVLYEGFPIGQVEQVKPIQEKDRIRFRVDLAVTEGWKIPADTKAEIASSGLLAAVTISLNAGKATDNLEPGSQIISAPSANVMAAVSNLARDISSLAETDIKPLLSNMNKTVGTFGDLLDAKGAALIEDVRLLIGDLTEQTPEIVDNIARFSKKLNVSADQFSKVLNPENIEALNSIIDDMELTTGNLAKLTVEFSKTQKSLDILMGDVGSVISDNRLDVDRSVVDLRHTVETISRHISAINQNLEGASRNMFEFSRQIRKNPGLLLGGTAPAEKAQKNDGQK
ncbi:MAG: MCE family protein [Rhodospirillaceae bacterium]|nr:MCE family protein [Rhodospirillaceae bacterium]MBT7268616.1 MCE family protein [Rhodospirillaceae bacterium]